MVCVAYGTATYLYRFSSIKCIFHSLKVCMLNFFIKFAVSLSLLKALGAEAGKIHIHKRRN